MKVDRFLILIFAAIFILGLVAYWQFRSFQKALEKLELPKFKIPEMRFFPEEKEKTEKEFVSPDGKLKFKYYSDWMEIKTQEIRGLFDQTTIEKGKTLFLAQKMGFQEMAFGLLIVQELESEKSLNEIIEETKAEIKERGGKVKILELDKEKGMFEAKYEKKGEMTFYSLQRVLKGENKVYLIAILSLEKGWQKLKQEAHQILNSAEVLI